MKTLPLKNVTYGVCSPCNLAGVDGTHSAPAWRGVGVRQSRPAEPSLLADCTVLAVVLCLPFLVHVCAGTPLPLASSLPARSASAVLSKHGIR